MHQIKSKSLDTAHWQRKTIDYKPNHTEKRSIRGPRPWSTTLFTNDISQLIAHWKQNQESPASQHRYSATVHGDYWPALALATTQKSAKQTSRNRLSYTTQPYVSGVVSTARVTFNLKIRCAYSSVWESVRCPGTRRWWKRILRWPQKPAFITQLPKAEEWLSTTDQRKTRTVQRKTRKMTTGKVQNWTIDAKSNQPM